MQAVDVIRFALRGEAANSVPETMTPSPGDVFEGRLSFPLTASVQRICMLTPRSTLWT